MSERVVNLGGDFTKAVEVRSCKKALTKLGLERSDKSEEASQGPGLHASGAIGLNESGYPTVKTRLRLERRMPKRFSTSHFRFLQSKLLRAQHCQRPAAASSPIDSARLDVCGLRQRY